MALELEKFLVYVQDENENVTEHRITVRHVDMLRGELVMAQEHVPESAKLNLVTAWVWAAMTRLGAYSKSFQHFRDLELLGLEDDGKETVDPTQPETPEGSG